MAWVLQTSVKEKHTKGFTFHKESYFRFEEVKTHMSENVFQGEFNYRPNLHHGFKFPFPERPYKMATSYRPDEFLNFMVSSYGILISQKAVHLVEELQPNVHQYFPVDIVLDQGGVAPEPYYFLNVCGVVQAVDYIKSAVHVRIRPENLNHPRKFNTRAVSINMTAKVGDPFREGSIFIEKSKVLGRALWVEDGLKNIICSDEFLSRINKIGGLGALEVLTRMEEI